MGKELKMHIDAVVLNWNILVTNVLVGLNGFRFAMLNANNTIMTMSLLRVNFANGGPAGAEAK